MTMTSSLHPGVAPKLKVPSVFAGKAWQQVLARDARADGQFFYAVKTTGIFLQAELSEPPAGAEECVVLPDGGAGAGGWVSGLSAV